MINETTTCDTKAPKVEETTKTVNLFFFKLSHVVKFFFASKPKRTFCCTRLWKLLNKEHRLWKTLCRLFYSLLAHIRWTCVCTLIYRFSVPFPLLWLNFSSFVRRGNILHSSRRHPKSRQNHVPTRTNPERSQRRRNSNAIGCLRLQVIDLLFLFHFFSYKGWKKESCVKKSIGFWFYNLDFGWILIPFVKL